MNQHHPQHYPVFWLLFLSIVTIVLGILVLGLHLTDSPPSLSIPGIVIIVLGLSGLLKKS